MNLCTQTRDLAAHSPRPLPRASEGAVSTAAPSIFPDDLPQGAEAVRLFILRRIVPEERGHSTPCWIWTGTRTPKGYARTELFGRKTRIHRASYEAYVGPIPEGLFIDHLCFVTSCVNPAHLEPVTEEENRIRQAATVTHCPNGHEYTVETVEVAKSGRRCRICLAARRGRVSNGPRQLLTHCKRGHELTPENTYTRGGRRCRICKMFRSNDAKRRRREKAAALKAGEQAAGSHLSSHQNRSVSHPVQSAVYAC